MKVKNMTKEELEILSFTDLTELILKENKKPMNTAQIFKKICDLLELGEDVYTEKLGDYYTSLTTDKRFILLENAEWDLRDKHKVEIVLDDDDEDEDFEDEEASEDNLEDESGESIEITDDEIDLDDDDDDMEDLTVIDEEDMEEDI